MKKSIFLFFAAILCAIGAKAFDQSAVDLYFDNSTSQWSECYVYIGHNNNNGWVSCYTMSRVSGTQYLWKLPANFNGGNNWGGATGWVVCKEKWWDSQEEDIYKFVYHGDKNVTNLTTNAWEDSKIYKADGTTTVDHYGQKPTVYKLTTSTKSDYTVTINAVTGGTLTVKDYDDATVSNGASKIKLTVLKFSAEPASGYVLEGVQINDGSTTTTISASEINTKTHTLTSNVTITPVWKATTSTVTVTTNATNGTVTGAGVYEEGTSVTLTATADAGYQFKNWTVAGAEVSTANPYTFTVDADITVTANFEELPKVTVYAINSVKWDAIAVHHWHKDGAGTEWPGDLMTNTGEKAPNGFDVYTITFLAEHENCIFNNNGNGSQTETLAVRDGQYYDLKSNEWYASLAEVPAPDPLATDVFLAGSMNAWSTTANEFKKVEEGSATATLTMNLEAETEYEFKVVREGAWTSSKDNSKITGSVSELVFSSSVGDNTMMTTTVAGDYVFTWNDSKLSITYPASTEPDPTPDPDPMTLYLLPNSNWIQANARFAVKYGENWADMVLVSGETNVYQVEIDKSQVSKISFHRMNPATTENKDDNCWNNSDPLTIPDGKNCCSINDGEWSCGTNVSWLNYPYKYYIAGTENLTGYHWDEDGLEITDDNSDGVYSKTFTALAADTYEFKITAGIWGLNWGYTNLPKGVEYNGVEQGKDEYGNANGNIKIILEETQDITINFNPANEEISIVGLEGTEVDVFEYYIVGDFNGWNTADVNFGMVKEGDVYKKEVTFAVGNEFKVCDGTWDNSWGMSNLGGKAYKEFEEGTGNIKMKEAKTFTIIFNPSENLITFDGLTETDPVVKDYSNQPATIYFRPSTSWKADNARFEVWFFDGKDDAQDKFMTMTDSNNDGVYEVANDKNYAKVIFVRMDPNKAENDWGSKLHQTGDIEIPNVANNLNTCYAFWINNIDNTAGTWVVPETIGSGNNSAFYTKYSGQTINVIVERTFEKEVLHTLCLPFSLPANWIGTAYQLSGVQSNNAEELVLYVKECSTFEAGKPYIVEPTNDELASKEYLLVDNVTISTTLTPNSVSNKTHVVTLKGILNGGGQTDGAIEYYIGTDGALHKEATNKLALRSIVEITDKSGNPVGVRARVAFNENVETGVEDIIATDAPVKVIVNGQLIIIRDGVKYNVQGQKL